LLEGNYDKPLCVVNRYDGIDLADKHCRILVLDSKPYSGGLIDRYTESCRPSSEVTGQRTARAITLTWHGVCSFQNYLLGSAFLAIAAGQSPGEIIMEPLQVAARFAAFACYLNAEARQPRSPEAAGRYASENWKRFLLYVHKDLGRFLTAGPPSVTRRTGCRPAPANKRPRQKVAV
jgi:hypothetical protein